MAFYVIQGEAVNWKRSLIDGHYRLHPKAKKLIQEAGLEIAPTWKMQIGQGNEVFYDGIPTHSPLRKFEQVLLFGEG